MDFGELDSWGNDGEDSDLDPEEEEQQRDIMIRRFQSVCAELMALDSGDTSKRSFQSNEIKQSARKRKRC